MSTSLQSGSIPRWPTAATGAAIAAVVLAHIRFVLLDVRLPRDLGLYYKSMPDLYVALGSGPPLHAAWEAMLTSGGWYNLLLSVVFRVFGRSPTLMQCIDICWVVGVLLLVVGIARRLGGPVAGLIAVLLAGR